MISVQSVASAEGDVAWTAAIAASSWYGPMRRRAERLLDQRRALGDLRVVPARAVLVGQEHEVAVVVDTGVPAGVVQEHQRDEAVDLGLVGHQGPQHPPRRMASAHSSRRMSWSPAVAE